ncbi:MAG: hypothetical protein ACTSV7_13475 [Candidatus Baldrarchaeia archaeon]
MAKIIEVKIHGILPKKTLWQRLKSLFNRKPEEIFLRIEILDPKHGFTFIPKMQGLAQVAVGVSLKTSQGGKNG